MMPCALPVECGVPDMQVTIGHMSSSSLDLFPGIPRPMSQNSCRAAGGFFWVTKQRMEIRSSCLHHFCAAKNQLGMAVKAPGNPAALTNGISYHWAVIIYDDNEKNFRCCCWLQLDAGGVSLFRHRIAIAATRSCSVRH